MKWHVAFLLVGLAGCASTDPLQDPTAWQPSGANEMNLAAELVTPMDAFQGRGSVSGSDGQQAVVAVLRARNDKVKALPDSSLSDLKVQGSGGGS